jgi:transcriptional regulator with XRE-family HTH domain
MASSVPDELRRWRTTRGLSQLELAIRAGTTQRHLSFVEQGRSRPGRDLVVRLAEAMANMFRHALHPNGLAPRVRNLPEWGRHITEHLRSLLLRSPDPSLEELLEELEGYLPPLPEEPDGLGFAVPLVLGSADGDLRLMTTISSFTTAVDVTLAELQLEAFLPVDDHTAQVLRRRWG